MTPTDPDIDAAINAATDPEEDTVTDNPFGEGFDLNALMQQAQAMQETLLSAQQELADAEVEGTAGGLVTVTVKGTGELAGVQVKVGSFDPDDADSLADLGDLIVAAYRDAKAHADALAQDKLGPLAGGLGGLGDSGPGSTPGLPGGGSGFGFGGSQSPGQSPGGLPGGG